MKKIIGIILVLMMSMCICACSSNDIKGLDKGLYLGNDIKSIQDNYEDVQVEDTYIEIKNVKAYSNKYTGKYFIKFDENNKIEWFSFSFDSKNGENAEETIELLSSLYGEPVHFENYKNQKNETSTIVWYVNDSTYAKITIYPESGKTYSVHYDKRNLSNEKLAKDKMKHISEITANDSELKAFYNFLLSRANIKNYGSIETAITLYGAEYESTGYFNDLEYADYSKFFGIDFKTEYTVNDPYSNNSKYDDFKGQIDMLSVSFDNSKDTTELVINKLNDLFGEYTESSDESKKQYKWEENLPITVTFTIFEDKKYDNALYLFKSVDYKYINPDFEYDNNVVYIPPYSDVDDSMLYGELGYIGYVGLDSDKGKQITSYITDFVIDCLKYPDNAEVYDFEIFKATDSSYNVKGKFKAQNAFGVFSVETFNIYLTDESGYLEVLFGVIAGQLF